MDQKHDDLVERKLWLVAVLRKVAVELLLCDADMEFALICKAFSEELNIEVHGPGCSWRGSKEYIDRLSLITRGLKARSDILAS